ncbi:hypothetical protein ABG768_007767 [Culter alburnus]|uniref:Uncharacterized protein n=1 Tax=Culter alburnus TaxID=194366 RepID=A0AAW1ZNG8_CULAL
MAANFVIRGSKLFYTGPSAQFMRLVVLSDEQRRTVLEECHNNPGTGNHGGVRATMDRAVVGYGKTLKRHRGHKKRFLRQRKGKGFASAHLRQGTRS